MTVHNKAVSYREGQIEFYYDEGSPGSLAMSTVAQKANKKSRRLLVCWIILSEKLVLRSSMWKAWKILYSMIYVRRINWV